MEPNLKDWRGNVQFWKGGTVILGNDSTAEPCDWTWGTSPPLRLQQDGLSQERRFRNLTVTLLWGHQWLQCHQGWLSPVLQAVFLWKKHKHTLNPILTQDRVLSNIDRGCNSPHPRLFFFPRLCFNLTEGLKIPLHRLSFKSKLQVSLAETWLEVPLHFNRHLTAGGDFSGLAGNRLAAEAGIGARCNCTLYRLRQEFGTWRCRSLIVAVASESATLFLLSLISCLKSCNNKIRRFSVSGHTTSAYSLLTGSRHQRWKTRPSKLFPPAFPGSTARHGLGQTQQATVCELRQSQTWWQRSGAITGSCVLHCLHSYVCWAVAAVAPRPQHCRMSWPECRPNHTLASLSPGAV